MKRSDIDAIQHALDTVSSLLTGVEEDVDLMVRSYGRILEIEHHADYVPADADDRAERLAAERTKALAFLADWAHRLLAVGQVDKTYQSDEVWVQARLASGWSVRASARATVVCEIRPVLDAGGEPVMVEVEERQYLDPVTVTKLVPQTERICPPSLLAGLTVPDEA